MPKFAFSIALLAAASIQSSLSATELLRVASWNIANLHHEAGVPLRDGAIPRDASDYERLRQVARSLRADIVSAQEIGSPTALRLIFPEEKYHLIVSDQYQRGDEFRPPEQRDIFVAFAISKEKFPEIPKVYTLDALAIRHLDIRNGNAEDRRTRSAMVVEFELEGLPVKLLAVHLKSFCHQWPLFPVEDEDLVTKEEFGSRFACRTLVAQHAILENWLEQQAAQGIATIVAGDFNRRMNVLDSNPTGAEHFWKELDDGSPSGLEFVKGPGGKDEVCWPSHAKRYDEHIDFVVVDKSILRKGISAEFKKISMGYEEDAEYADRNQQKLSDHCPVLMTLKR